MSDNPFIDKAIQALKLSPLKVTSQRLLLIEILFKNGNNHYTAEDVHKEVEKKNTKFLWLQYIIASTSLLITVF